MRKARGELERKAKGAQKEVRKLFDQALVVEQLAMFDEPEFEPDVLLERPQLLKKHTAKRVDQIEWRRDLCLYLLSVETPAREIARLLKMSNSTVTALAAKHGRKLGQFTQAFAERLMASAASDIALADTKREDANYKDLHIGAGIKMQHAVSVRLVSESGMQPALEVDESNDKLKNLREKMKLLKPAGNNRQDAQEAK